jgi:tetratricopeptide (TPR) repeat protein
MHDVNSTGLRWLLRAVNGLVCLLIVNALYLVAVRINAPGVDPGASSEKFQWMFLAHLFFGVLLVPVFLAYLMGHVHRGRGRHNARARLYGALLALSGTAVIASGLLLTRGIPWLELQSGLQRAVYYWLHVALPLPVFALAVMHRRAGSGFRWNTPALTGIAALLLTAGFLHLLPGGESSAPEPVDAVDFSPSLASTEHGGLIAAPALMMDDYCADCHQDIHASWAQSAHRFSSLNNPVYAFSFENTRNFLHHRDGSAEAIRFCAGCHDPVLMFSGRLMQAEVEEPEARAGITCIACHAITDIKSTRGNADYVIGVPGHYPFADSQNALLKWVNHQLIKANPAYHKQTFLKPLHREPEFCGSCHKVHIPKALNNYKWLRGQNHYDSFILSGVSGAGVNSFYYPDKPLDSCGACHMKAVVSTDLAATRDAEDGAFKVRDHLIPGGHSALSRQMGIKGQRDEKIQEMLEGSLRVDLFGLRKAARPDGTFLGPTGVNPVVVRRGDSYLLEVVLRTLTPGHAFTQGTADSNEVWLEILVREGTQLRYHSGRLDPTTGAVDPDAHFVNSYLVDRNGERISTRNVEDIFATVYNHQIGPGAADTIHYEITVPANAGNALTVEARLHYRKFSSAMVTAVNKDAAHFNDLPVITIASDRIKLAVEGGTGVTDAARPVQDTKAWERWNDYGIGLLAKPGLGQLRQAEEAFRQVEDAGSAAGAINLARTYLRGGQLDGAAAALSRATTDDRVAPPWTRAWLESELALSNGRVDAAIALLKQLAASDFPGASERGFDFSRDYRVWLRLGQAFWLRARMERGTDRQEFRTAYLAQAENAYQEVLRLEPEMRDAHYGLAQLYRALGDSKRSLAHGALHEQYRPDDSARGRAVAAARDRDSAARRATNDIVVYPLSTCIDDAC